MNTTSFGFGSDSAGGGGSGSFGVLGIANALGQYTYYSDYTTALAAALPGQTIEQFADIVETNAVTITLQDNVFINMNGHRYTLEGNFMNHCFEANGITTTIFNGYIYRNYNDPFLNDETISCISVTTSILNFNGVSLEAKQCSNLILSGSNIDGSLTLLSNWVNLYQIADLNYLKNVTMKCTGYKTMAYTAFGETWFTNCSIESWGKGLQGDILFFFNCDIISTGGYGVNAASLNAQNTTIISVGDSIEAIGNFVINNCFLYSYGGIALNTPIDGSGTLSNSYVVSYASWGAYLQTQISSFEIDNNEIVSYTFSGLQVVNTTDGQSKVFNNKIRGTSLSGTSYGLFVSAQNLAQIHLLGNFIENYGATLTSYAIKTLPASTIYYVDNKIKTINPVPLDPLLVQAQINTDDNYGNILIG